jgi:tetratricopeptide (TPR) repeat protein
VAINREKLLEAAQKFVDKKKYDKAIVELRRLVDADPNDARTLHKIGELQHRQGLYAEAIDTFDSVGKLYANGGFAQKAIAVYKQARDIIATQLPQAEERYGHIPPKLADLYIEIGLTSDALLLLEEVARRLSQQQKGHESIIIFRKISEIDGNNPLAHLRLAEALSKAHDLDGAVSAFKQAAQVLIAAERRDDAIQVLERLLYHRPDPEQARICGELYLMRNRPPHDVTQALAKLQICYQANPRDLEALGLIARAFGMIGQTQKAIEVQKQIAMIARDSGQAHVFRDVVMHLLRVAPNDPQVRQLAQQVQ